MDGVERLTRALFPGPGKPPHPTRITVDRVLATLKPKHEKVIRGLYGVSCEPRNAPEIATELQLTREGIRQINNKGLRDLRSRWSDVLHSSGTMPEKEWQARLNPRWSPIRREVLITKKGITLCYEAEIFIPANLAATSIEKLRMPDRVINALMNANIHTIGDMASPSPDEIMRIKNLGSQGHQLLIDALVQFGIYDLLPNWHDSSYWPLGTRSQKHSLY